MQQFVLLVIMLVASRVFTPRPRTSQPAPEQDKVPSTSASKSIPVLFGRAWIHGGNIVDYGDRTSVPIFSSGGKK